MNVSWSGTTVGERVPRRREPESAHGFAAAFVDAVDEWMLELQQVAERSCEFVKGAGAVYAGDVAVRVAQIPLLVFWPANRPEERRYCVVEIVQADPLGVRPVKMGVPEQG